MPRWDVPLSLDNQPLQNENGQICSALGSELDSHLEYRPRTEQCQAHIQLTISPTAFCPNLTPLSTIDDHSMLAKQVGSISLPRKSLPPLSLEVIVPMTPRLPEAGLWQEDLKVGLPALQEGTHHWALQEEDLLHPILSQIHPHIRFLQQLPPFYLHMDTQGAWSWSSRSYAPTAELNWVGPAAI